MPERAKLQKDNSVSSLDGSSKARKAKSLWSDPALLAYEDPETYQQCRDKVFDAIIPKSYIETILAQDVVDGTWEAVRLRRLRTEYLNAHECDGVRSLLEASDNFRAKELARDWSLGDPKAINKVEEFLEKRSITEESLMAETFVEMVASLELLDRLISAAESRRNSALREIDRHRLHQLYYEKRLNNALERPPLLEIRPLSAGVP